MQFVINDNNIITAYANVGRLKNGVDFFGDFPADFVPNKYKWQTVEPEIGEDGDIITPCFIVRKNVISEPTVDENGDEYTIERDESVSEYGKIVINPDYAEPIKEPEITMDDIMLAIAELAESMEV